MSQELSFFARRRAALKAEREAELAALQPEVVEEITPEEPDLSTMSDAGILDLLELPDPDTLRKGDDFAAFMSRAVPLHLRNRALRKLWRSDPVLACLDGLNDYDADYLAASTGQGVIKTSYQVGKGLLAHVEAMAAQAESSRAATDDTPTDMTEAVDTAPVEPDEPDEADVVETDQLAQADNPGDEDDGRISRHIPRRMRFDFGDRA